MSLVVLERLLRRLADAAAARPRHLVAAALVGGLAASLGAPRLGPLLLVACAAAAAVAASRPEGRGRLAAVVLAVGLAGCWWGSLRLAALDASVLEQEIGEAAPALVEVAGPPRRGLFSVRAPAVARRFGRVELREPVLLELPRGRSPPQGAILRVIATVEEPRPPRDGFDERAWLRRQGRHVVLRAQAFRVVGRRGGIAGFGDRVRAHLADTIAPGLEGEREALVAGIVLGEDEGLGTELQDAFRASGLYHLLAVSGQNVAFIAVGVVVLAWLVGIGRWSAQVAVLLAIGGYVLAVGWQPSVVRAGVAGALTSLAWLTARPADRWYFLLAGAAILLAWNPYALQEPGFQLSFTAVVAIFLAVRPFERRLHGYPVPQRLGGVIAVSTVCGVATAPIAWLHFGAVPAYALPANVLAAPVMGPILGFGLLTAALDPVLPPAALALAWVNGWLVAYLAGCARLVAALPYARVESGRVLGAAALVAAAAVGLSRLRNRPARRAAALTVAALLALVAGWRLVSAPAPLAAPSGLRLVFLDIGQGDSVLVQAPGANVLVDQGPPEGRAAEQLLRLGVRRLQLLVLTHPQRDHIGGAPDVLRRLRVDAVLDPRLALPSPFEDAALREARRHRVPVLTARAGTAFRLGRMRVSVVWPNGPGGPADDPNLWATVLLVSYGGIDALLSADAESDVTLPLRLPPVEIMKVAHHGSADPGLPELLRRLRPRIAVISVGRHNDYGHPRATTLHALDAAPGLSVFRTDLDGRVVVESDGGRLVVHGERRRRG